MTRLLFTVALLSLLFYLARRVFAQLPRSPAPQRGRRQPPLRGAPRALVCGQCSTQFEPGEDGWKCPNCGQ